MVNPDRPAAHPQKASFLQKATRAYHRIFSVHEIENDSVLQWCLGFLLAALLLNYRTWASNVETTVFAVKSHTAVCWSFFPSCTKWIFLNLPPEGYSQILVFTCALILISTAAFFIYRKCWLAAHACMLVLYLARSYFFAIHGTYYVNYWFYINYFGFIFLIIPHKKFFSRLLVVMCYYLASNGKISDAWTLGTYFSSSQLGLALIPSGWEIFFTNLVIAAEMVASWFLFSGNKILQRSVLIFFVCFHFYSTTVVSYNFPSVILPWLVLLFGPDFVAYNSIPTDNKSVAGWSFIAFLTFLQMIPVIIPGDDKYTQEGTFYSLHMINTNNQCYASLSNEAGVKIIDGQARGPEAMGLCQLPATVFVWQQKFCTPGVPRRLHFRYDRSLNGHPYYRIVDQPDFCNLQFKPFTHNAWIKDSSNAPVLYNPRYISGVSNHYAVQGSMLNRGLKSDTKLFHGKDTPNALTPLQQRLMPHIYLINSLWWSLWFAVMAYLFSRFLLLQKGK